MMIWPGRGGLLCLHRGIGGEGIRRKMNIFVPSRGFHTHAPPPQKPSYDDELDTERRSHGTETQPSKSIAPFHGWSQPKTTKLLGGAPHGVPRNRIDNSLEHTIDQTLAISNDTGEALPDGKLGSERKPMKWSTIVYHAFRIIDFHQAIAGSFR